MPCAILDKLCKDPIVVCTASVMSRNFGIPGGEGHGMKQLGLCLIVACAGHWPRLSSGQQDGLTELGRIVPGMPLGTGSTHVVTLGMIRVAQGRDHGSGGSCEFGRKVWGPPCHAEHRRISTCC